MRSNTRHNFYSNFRQKYDYQHLMWNAGPNKWFCHYRQPGCDHQLGRDSKTTGLRVLPSGTVARLNLAIETVLEVQSNFQYDILYPDLNVSEHMTFYGALKRLPKQEIAGFSDWILKFLGMNGALKTLSNNLSGGMKRKLSIAISLIGKPQFLILDEPTSG